jgi:hypothetical protein
LLPTLCGRDILFAGGEFYASDGSPYFRLRGRNLPLALGDNCGHTFACSRFLLSRIDGDAPARN